MVNGQGNGDVRGRIPRDGGQYLCRLQGKLLAFIALIALINGVLGWLGGLWGYPQLSMELITGYLFSPVAFLIGVPWKDCFPVGALLGKKLILNEFVAYFGPKQLIEARAIGERSVTIATYALCGFSNFSSIAIQIGGIGAIAPSRRKDLALLGMKSLLCGTLACLMTACIAGLLI